MRVKLIAGISFVIVILFMSLMFVRPTLTQHLVKNLPQNLEKELSGKLLKSIQNDIKVCAPFENIKNTQVIILSTSDKKVFTLPDRKIVLSKGLIQHKTQAELLTILGREMELLQKKDALRKIIQSLPMTFQLKLLLRDYSSLLEIEVTELLKLVSAPDHIESESIPVKFNDNEWKEVARFCTSLPKIQKKKIRIRKRKKIPSPQIKKDNRSLLEKARDEGKFQYPVR